MQTREKVSTVETEREMKVSTIEAEREIVSVRTQDVGLTKLALMDMMSFIEGNR